jgi:hypothetical protein
MNSVAAGEIAMSDPLERDLETYKALLPTLTGSEGKYALIFEGNLKGVFESYSDALNAGYGVAALKPFLIKQIAATEFVAYFTRDVDAVCHT